MRGVEGLWGVWRVCEGCGGSVRGVEGLSMRLVLCFCNTGTVQCRTGWRVVGFTFRFCAMFSLASHTLHR